MKTTIETFEFTKYHDLHKIKDLIESKKIDPNIKSKYNWTLMHDCSLYYNVDIMKYLLEIGANPNIKNKNGYTPLHFFIHHIDIDDKMIKYNTKFQYNDIEIFKFDNMFKLLLKYNTDPYIKDNDGKTPLDYIKNDKENILNIIRLHKLNKLYGK